MAKKSNSKKLWLIGGLAAAIAAGYFWVSAQLKLVSFGNVSIPFQQLKGGQINLGLTLPINNASSLGAQVTGFFGYITAPSGSVVGAVHLAAPASIVPYGQSVMKFKTSIRIGDIGGEILALITGGTLPNDITDLAADWAALSKYFKGYRIKGQVRVYGVPLPIDEPLL